MSIFSKTEHDSAIILDIGSASVSLAYVTYKRDIPEILYAQRHNTSLSSFTDFDSFLKHILEASNSLFSHLARNSKYNSPERIFCYLPTLLHFSQVRHIHKKFIENKIITENIIKHIVSGEIDKFKKSDNFLADNFNGNKSIILEQKTTNIVLNGYPVSNPYKKKANELNLSVFISYTSEKILNSIASVVQNVFHRDDIEFHTGTIALFDVLRSVFASYKHFIALNLTGEAAELLVIQDDEIEHIITYPFGYRTFIKQMAKNLSTTLDDAKTIIKLYAEGSNYKINNRIEEAIRLSKNEWKEHLAISLKKHKISENISNNIIIIGDPIFSTFNKKWLKEEEKTLHISNYPLNISHINIKYLLPYIKLNKTIQKNIYTLIIKAIFSKKII